LAVTDAGVGYILNSIFIKEFQGRAINPMMLATGTIFVDFQLPNATTWFYFALLLAVALFWKFSRFLSVRNLDVLSLFLLVPGLLLLQEAHGLRKEQPLSPNNGLAPAGPVPPAGTPEQLSRTLGYAWLLGGSGFFLIRCLIDLALVRRPALTPNLSLGGLAWLACALFVCLVSVAVRPRQENTALVGKRSPVTEEMESVGERTAGNMAARVAGQGADGFDAGRWARVGLAILCHLAVVAGLIFIGYRHFQDGLAGMAAATFYLLLPYTAMFVGEWHHVLPVALLVWAVAVYRRPMLAGFFLGLAAGSMYFPLLVVPLWISFYWRRGAGRFAAAFALTAAATLATSGFILWMQGELAGNVRSTLALADWQAWKAPTSESIWQGIHWAYRVPVFIAYSAFVITTAFWPAPKNLAHVLALSAAVLIGVQFWYADQGGVYVLWYLPLLLLLTFRPNLSDRRPPVIAAENDWLAALGRRLRRLILRLVRFPEPAARVG
jgi:hypothetical protein